MDYSDSLLAELTDVAQEKGRKIEQKLEEITASLNGRHLVTCYYKHYSHRRPENRFQPRIENQWPRWSPNFENQPAWCPTSVRRRLELAREELGMRGGEALRRELNASTKAYEDRISLLTEAAAELDRLIEAYVAERAEGDDSGSGLKRRVEELATERPSKIAATFLDESHDLDLWYVEALEYGWQVVTLSALLNPPVVQAERTNTTTPTPRRGRKKRAPARKITQRRQYAIQETTKLHGGDEFSNKTDYFRRMYKRFHIKHGSLYKWDGFSERRIPGWFYDEVKRWLSIDLEAVWGGGVEFSMTLLLEALDGAETIEPPEN